MIQIKIKPKLENQHLSYFENKILTKIESEIKKPYKLPLSENPFSGTHLSAPFETWFHNQHVQFMEYVKRHYRDFATGSMTEIRRLETYIKQNFRTVWGFISLSPAYSEHLQGLFGYAEFKTKGLYEYILAQVRKNTGAGSYHYTYYADFRNVLLTVFPKTKDYIDDYFPKTFPVRPYGKLLEPKYKEMIQHHHIDLTLKNYEKLDVFLDEWNPYSFVMQLELKVCPYCNRQYVTPVLSDKGMVRADLDHFLPKSKYPYFSMSLYNLVPSCKTCNQSMKLAREFDIASISPYEDSVSDHFKFEADFTNKEIQTTVTGNPTVQEHIDMFKLETLYNYHWNQADELMHKKKMYTDLFFETVLNNYKSIFRDKKHVMEIILGYQTDRNKFNHEICSKFRSDIIEQLGFHDSKLRSDLKKARQALRRKRLHGK